MTSVRRTVVSPFTRTGGYYARSWRRYLAREQGTQLPVARPTLALAREAFRDEIVLAAFHALRPLSEASAYERIDQEVATAVALYERNGWLGSPERFLTTPPRLTTVTIRTVTSRRRPYERLSFESGYAPHVGEPGRARWLGYVANARVRAWMLRHDQPRPWLVCVHGAVMGRPAVDLALFRARWLHEELGLNVLLPVLPLHGPRGVGLPKGVAFPGEDILDDVHATAQAVWDVRRLLSWIRSRDDGPIGLTSISLGGLVAALVAGLEDGLLCAILGVPVADLVGLLARHSGLSPQDTRLAALERAGQLGGAVSPLAIAPRVPLEGRFIYAGVADRLVHPRDQVTRLWEHWGRPQIAWYPGGHTGFFRSQPVQRFVLDALLQSRMVDPSAPGARGRRRPAAT